MNTKEAILTRRSNRKYKAEAIDESIIEELVEAGRCAPSGGNSQSNHFFVITEKEALDALAEKVQNAFKDMEITEGMYRSLASSITQSKQGNYHFFYHAPCLIVIANQKDYGNHMADVACALENIFLMANELNLSSCYINQLKWLNEEENILEWFRAHGLKDEERIYGAVAIGYPDTEDGMPMRTRLRHDGNPVTYIR